MLPSYLGTIWTNYYFCILLHYYLHLIKCRNNIYCYFTIEISRHHDYVQAYTYQLLLLLTQIIITEFTLLTNLLAPCLRACHV